MAQGDRCGVDGCRRAWEFEARVPGRAVVVGRVTSGVYIAEEAGSRRVEEPGGVVRVEVEEGPDRSWPEPSVDARAEGVTRFCRPHLVALGMVGAVGEADARWWLEAGA